MPQLDPSSFTSQLFWLTVSFVTLYVLLARFLLPRVGGVLALRAHTLESDIAAAARMKAEAEAAQALYEKALSDARAKSQSLLAEAQASVSTHTSEQQAALQKTIEARLAESDGAIARAKQAALSNISPVSEELASLIVQALVHHKPSPQDVGAAMSGVAKDRIV